MFGPVEGTIQDLRNEVFEEFSMSKYATRGSRDVALVDEIIKLRRFRSDVGRLGLFLTGGYYEPRNDTEAALAGRIADALAQSGADFIRRETWMESSRREQVEIQTAKVVSIRQDQASESSNQE